MACANPFAMEFNGIMYSIPCGWCLNCRVDHRNFLEDMCRFEKADYPSTTFLTLTYSDEQIEPHLRRASDGSLVATLCRSDIKNFNKRLRSTLSYYGDKLHHSRFLRYREKNGKYIPDIKTLQVGEYGGDGQIFDRPHFHSLLFGVDPEFCADILNRSWHGGILDYDYIKTSGGIRYVLKYLDKQLHGKDVIEKYDNNGLERPFMTHSQRLGYNHILENLDDICQHNFTYLSHGHIRRPLSTYYKNLLMAEPDIDNDYLQEYFKSYRIKPAGKEYSLKQINELRKKISQERLKHLERQCEDAGVPVLRVGENHLLSDSKYISGLVLDALDPIPF